MKINLGAGGDPKEGMINVDMLDLPGIDIIHNLMNFPYPFQTNSADYIGAVDLVEHLDNYIYGVEVYQNASDGIEYRLTAGQPTVIAFIEECHRILKPGGELFMQMPGWKSPLLWIDVTHVRGFDIQSFDFFDPDTEFGKTRDFYSEAKFKITKKNEFENGVLQFWLEKR